MHPAAELQRLAPLLPRALSPPHRVENFFCRIKRHRRVSTRYEKLASAFFAFVQLAAVLDWLNS